MLDREASGMLLAGMTDDRMPDGVTAVHVLVPGLERFFAVIRGTVLMPGPRAQAMLHARAP